MSGGCEIADQVLIVVAAAVEAGDADRTTARRQVLILKESEQFAIAGNYVVFNTLKPPQPLAIRRRRPDSDAGIEWIRDKQIRFLGL